MVAKRLGDLTELKSQFEAEAAMLTQRIEELATTFERAASSLSNQQQPEPQTEQSQTPQEPTTRRRRRIGSELTLDD